MKFKIEIFVRGRSVLLVDAKTLQKQLEHRGDYVEVYTYYKDLTVEVTTEQNDGTL